MLRQSTKLRCFLSKTATSQLAAGSRKTNIHENHTYSHFAVVAPRYSSSLSSRNGKSTVIFVQSNSFHTTGRLSADLIEVHGPAFAESITEGDIKWVKSPGDFVKADEIVAQIETDKTVVDVPAPQDGFLENLLVEDGSKVVAKQKLYLLKPGSQGSQSAQAPPPQAEHAQFHAAPSHPSPPVPPPTFTQAPPQLPTMPPPPPTQPFKSIPHSEFIPIAKPPPAAPTAFPQAAAKVVAPPAHVSPEKAITGTRSETRVKMNRMRQRIADRLKDAQNTYAMLTTFNEIDMSNILSLRSKYKEAFAKKHGIKFGLMSPFIKASAYALLDQPVVNAVIDEGEIVYRHFIDLSVAVATERGLVVPVLRNVESMSVAQIERELADLGEKARHNRLAIEDMEGGTFTVSNGGVFGSLFGTPIINPPQSAILGMHATNDRPVAINGKVEVRPVMIVALTYDHRLIDGREAVTFLKKIKQAIEDPAIMLLDL